ncbi:hypothetical protein D7322_20320 [Sphingobacterium puteale]|uniref:Uncharacterized protein n=1 Tax=Sphingobacterium puteale TaxID=2420510 RepID=A0A420VUE7_9SPHI|nr:hypothetical protein [Sphingobacterium puteale]RKO69905.1 hypothetical protein D7322_20320 [Sphingobacterium puteale]
MKTKSQTKKEGYMPPTLKITIVEMEEGIAAGSAQVTPGGSGGTPLVEDYNESTDQQTWDF